MRHQLVAALTVTLTFAASSARADEALVGSTWRLVHLGATPIFDAPHTRLMIDPYGGLRSFVGCNELTGWASVSSRRLTFNLLASTGKACPTDAAKQEDRFVAALDATRFYTVHDGALIFNDASGKTLVTFAADHQ